MLDLSNIIDEPKVRAYRPNRTREMMRHFKMDAVVLFDYGGALHLSDHLETIDEARFARRRDYFGSGNRAAEHPNKRADAIAYMRKFAEPGVTENVLLAKMNDIYVPNRYAEMIHGIGFGVEYPVIYYPEDHETWQYSGTFEEGMCVCVESYIGPVGGDKGGKLEQPVLITANGPVALTDCPFGEDYL